MNSYRTLCNYTDHAQMCTYPIIYIQLRGNQVQVQFTTIAHVKGVWQWLSDLLHGAMVLIGQPITSGYV